MMQRCPICKKRVEYPEGGSLPEYFPFCSERCQLVDLGKWLETEYRISSPLPDGEDRTGFAEPETEE